MILGLDVAKRCGFAYGDGSALPTFGTYEGDPAGEELGLYGRAFRNWLRDLVLRLKADAEARGQTLRVIFEAPVFPKPFLEKGTGRIIQHASIKDRRQLYGLAMLVEVVCGDLGVPCYEEPVQALKQALTGKGNAEKDDMVRAAKKMGANVQFHDEADAIAAWLIGVRIYARQHLHRWDALLWGRGAGGLL